MAAQDKDVGPSPGSAWASIHQAVREQLPSLDSDSSLSDCGEEELFIFQRNHPALIPDLSEELAEEAAGAWDTVAHGSPPVAGLVPVDFDVEPWSEQNTSTGSWASPEGRGPGNHVGGCGKTSSSPGVPEDTTRWQEGDLGVTTSKARGAQNLPKGPRGETICVPPKGGLDTEHQSAAPHEGKDPNCARRQALRRERRKMIEKDVLHRVPWEARALGSTAVPPPPHQEPREGPLVLSLQQLEESDLDGLLQRLAGPESEPGEGAPGAMWQAKDCLQHQGLILNTAQENPHKPILQAFTTQGTLTSQPAIPPTVPFHSPKELQAQAAQQTPTLSADTERHVQDGLMEQLVLLCASQSRAYASAWKVPAASTLHTRPLEATPRHAFRELDPPGAQGMKLRSAVEPPTVFMDLRIPEPSDQETEESSSSSSFDDEDDDKDEETAAPGDQLGPRGLRDCTGKSWLLQQLRASRQGLAQPAPPVLKSPRSQKVQAPADTVGFATRRQSIQARPLGGSARDLGDPPGPGTAREALVPPM